MVVKQLFTFTISFEYLLTLNRSRKIRKRTSWTSGRTSWDVSQLIWELHQAVAILKTGFNATHPPTSHSLHLHRILLIFFSKDLLQYYFPFNKSSEWVPSSHCKMSKKLVYLVFSLLIKLNGKFYADYFNNLVRRNFSILKTDQVTID